ncbi:unnamed protein product [Adineta ricciae]|uniref:Uncharacterized protein n=1 Tax=Adineta ricciae TaxID=249248 RepID=A0A813ZNR1_ADIRI|nr:unnamed protein product [Adineta ricciae]
MLLDENDPLVSLLHVIQRRSNLDKSIENDSKQANVDYDTQLQNTPSTKSVPCRNFAALENKRSRKKPKQLNTSFYANHLPIKYGFQIRSLIEKNLIPSWRFSNDQKNQIIYKSSSIENNLSISISSRSKQVKFSQLPTVARKSPNPPLQRHWINPWLNSRQLREHHKQLSLHAQRDIHLSSKSNTSISNRVLPSNVMPQKERPCDKQRSKIRRRKRCVNFEEHLQRYYSSRWCFISTRRLLT